MMEIGTRVSVITGVPWWIPLSTLICGAISIDTFSGCYFFIVPGNLAKAYSISNLNLAQLRDRNIMVSVPIGNICTSRGLVSDMILYLLDF
jgi:hypothetical protein